MNTKHFLRFPSSQTLFGAVIPTDCTAEFEVEDDAKLNFTSVTGNFMGKTLDLSYLTQDEMISNFFVSLVLSNKSQWDVEDIWYRGTSLNENGTLKLSIVR